MAIWTIYRYSNIKFHLHSLNTFWSKTNYCGNTYKQKRIVCKKLTLLFYFLGFFTELLIKSKLKFHRLFRKTYGIIYERNSDVFIDFFRDLESYYDHGNVSEPTPILITLPK